MSNIIDFKSGKPKKGPKKETNTPPAGFREMIEAADLLFSDLPQHDMMYDAADAVRRRVSKLLIFTALVAQTNEAIRKVGLEPSGFMVNEMSLDLFITKDLPHVSREDQESIEHYNGPFFEDDGDDRWIYRVATTVFEEDDGVGMATEVLRLDRDAESWETWYDGKWRRNGPPAHIFEVIAMETVKEMVEEISGAPVPEIYDDDEDDDEDWENSIESLMVTPGIIAALGRAGIETIEQLTNMTEREVLAIKGIGKKALEDIKDALDFEDLTLRE